MNSTEAEQPDLYRVGLLDELWFLYRTAIKAPSHVGDAWRRLAYGWRGSWRRRSYWNGWLAEVPTEGVSAGHGWSRRRALRSLNRRLGEVGHGD